MEIKAKIWLEIDGRPIIGEGRAQLLELIDETKSISESAKRMGISYRYAWGTIKEIEDNLGKSIITSSRGGAGGGKTELTEEGKAL
ncbi:MAG: LysR family transcriptional regulator, partial [Candidatus Thermoplasmatota archaeon]|nr:LysR family transcriptional regulator [Candidatus Thermoplasmatota archaeon]